MAAVAQVLSRKCKVDERLAELERQTPASGLLGYLNFSDGRPDPRWQRGFNDAFAFFVKRGDSQPWLALCDWLSIRLEELRAGGTAAFRDVTQARGVLGVFPAVLNAYRAHHADLLFHQSERDLCQPFFLARVLETILAKGAPWNEQERIVRRALHRLNDFVGHRPIAILETRPRGEPYDHERVRPIPLFVRGAGVASGRYQQLLKLALDILAAAEPAIQQEAGFDPRLLDEFAVDPRAYDYGHPANKRSNYVFGEWDPHHLDDQGRFRRYVARQITLDALLDRVAHPGDLDPQELLVESAAVLAGTVLMAMGVSGASPTAYDSSTTLTTLMPRIARYRDAFYVHVLQSLSAKHAARLRQEQERTRQPFGAARQHLNQYLARHRAAQMQQRFLGLLFAEMGYPEASREEAAKIPAASIRMLSEILSRLTTARLRTERGDLTAAAALLPQIEELLHRGIACGAMADPWNILGFQALYPLSPAREDSVRDQRTDELIHVVEHILSLYARVSAEAAAAGMVELGQSALAGMKRNAAWWDQFASVEVGDVRRVSGAEALASARHVSAALSRWRERGESAGDLAFWKQQLDSLHSPKAFALVADALLRKDDYRAAMALLIHWLGQAEQVPLENGEHSFHTLALRWMLSQARSEVSGPDLIRRFFDYLEANAEEYWQVPTLEVKQPQRADEPEEGLFEAAYEGVTYRDSADDEQEGSVIGDDPHGEELDLEAEGEDLNRRLHFLSTVARLWQIAARRAPANREALVGWFATARANQRRLLALLDSLSDHTIPKPLGSYDSLLEYDRRRVLREQLLDAAIGTCLDNYLAVGSLRGAIEEGGAEVTNGERPSWEPFVLQLERAFFQGDAAAARALLPAFLERFESEPLVAPALSEGAERRLVLRVRIAQTMLRALVTSLPRLGMLRETYHVLKTALRMEQKQHPPARGVTQFNHLLEAAYQAVLENVIASAEGWTVEQAGDVALVDLLDKLTAPFAARWSEHSRTLHVSVLENAPSGDSWDRLREFIQKYGGDLFHARFMTLANLRSILHRGVDSFLDYLAENPDPLRPVRLLDDLDTAVPRKEAASYIQLILQSLVENYEEFKDYNTTTSQSDYGKNLFVLLDFLRLKASYERQAWQFRPLVLAHEALARAGRIEAAVLWQEAFTQATREIAARHREELARLERTHGIRLSTVADRLHEDFIKPLAVARLCALIEPAMEEAQGGAQPVAFPRLQRELQVMTAQPTGAGLDVPHWLRQLEAEVRHVWLSNAKVAVLASDFVQIAQRLISYEEVQRQLSAWDEPLGAAPESE
jgi:hypothetical protein